MPGAPAKPRPIYKLNKRTPLTAQSPFSAESIRAELKRVVGNKYREIGQIEASELASILNFWHATFYRAQQERRFNDLAAETREAILRLQQLLPDVVASLQERDATAKGADPFVAGHLAQAEKFADTVQLQQMHYLHPFDLPGQAVDWRWLIQVLPMDIEAAIRPTSPDLSLGRSKSGPLANILSAIIPLITGEHLTAVAIGNQLIKLGSVEDKSSATIYPSAARRSI